MTLGKFLRESRAVSSAFTALTASAGSEPETAALLAAVKDSTCRSRCLNPLGHPDVVNPNTSRPLSSPLHSSCFHFVGLHSCKRSFLIALAAANFPKCLIHCKAASCLLLSLADRDGRLARLCILYLIYEDKHQAVFLLHCLPDASKEGRYQLAALRKPFAEKAVSIHLNKPCLSKPACIALLSPPHLW